LADAARAQRAAPIGPRIAWAVGFAVAIALVYLVLVLASVAPWPRSLGDIARSQTPHRGYALVSGYYLAQPFTANGNGLPPYAFGDESTREHSGESVRVTPTLADLRAYRVIALIDLATGDGTEWNPYVIHTVGSVASVVLSTVVGILVLAALLFWAAGAAAAVAPVAARRSTRQAAT